jgi:hypothetical protein
MSDWPPDDPSALAEFPKVKFDTDDVLYRVHRANLDPAYFSNSGDGRFDPPRHSRAEYGTCYVSASADGAFLEALGRIRPLPDYVVRERVISEVSPTKSMIIADLTDSTVIGAFGIGGDVSVGAEYSLPQAWSAAFRSAGFEGIRYTARHDPTFCERSLALFGPPGEQPAILQPRKDTTPEPIGDDFLQHIQDRFAITVVPLVVLDL